VTDDGRARPGRDDHAASRAGPPAAHAQAAYDVRFDWGVDGLEACGAGAAAIVIVDVLRFTTAVSVAVARGAEVLPYVWGVGDAAAAHARRHDAELAGRREDGDWSLSPADLLGVPAGTRLVLPSPNGSTLAFAAADLADGVVVLAGCLRNASAVAGVAAAVAGPVAVIAAGERWHGDLGAMRPAVEDLVGAGAVLAGVADRRRSAGPGSDDPSVSPEAAAAIAAFASIGDDVEGWLASTGSGRELVDRGWADDVAVAAALDADTVAPVLHGSRFGVVEPAPAGDLR
jgi:2-phosphosulfolactate phosphatase